MKNLKYIVLSLFLFLIFLSCGNEKKNSQGYFKIVCFGDSLTKGHGAEKGKSYPDFLQKMLGVPVVNSGVNGETSAGALKRVDDIIKQKPSMVIVEFGANDFFQQVSISKTQKNMEQIVDKLQNSGITVVLASTQDIELADLYRVLKTLAKKKKIPFIDGILNEFWDDRELFSDSVHPNSKGYELVAEKIYKNIEPLIESL